MNRKNDRFSFEVMHWENWSRTPQISDTEGPLGADLSFPGDALIHLFPAFLRPRIDNAALDKLLADSLQALLRRNPQRRPLLVGWQVDEHRLPRLHEVTEDLQVSTIFCLVPLFRNR
jgi:hypothetical protein